MSGRGDGGISTAQHSLMPVLAFAALGPNSGLMGAYWIRRCPNN